MKPSSPAEIIEHILVDEGGFVNDPADPGGPTKYGVTLETLEAWRGRDNLTAADVEALGIEEARQILTQRYYLGPGLDKLANIKVELLAVDMFVNHGPRRATQIIQRALKLPVDGILGPKTFAALDGSRVGNDHVFDALIAERLRFYARHTAANPQKLRFLVGWIDRAADMIWED